MPILRYLDPEGTVQHGQLHADGSRERLLGDPWRGLRPSGEQARVQQLLCPVEPRAILGIGVNYRRHALEFGSAIPRRPVLFFKAPGAHQHPGAPIELPSALASAQVDYEGELAVVIGRRCKNVRRDEALACVLGYTCANDVSARDWQKRPELGGGQWCRGKSFDSFCPLGQPVPISAIADLQNLELTTRLNGEVVQQANTATMIFSVARLIAELSQGTTLLAGSVILTGTPAGVGAGRKPPRFLRDGDVVDVEISGIGLLSNPVRNRS